jgi:hypothetical protein
LSRYATYAVEKLGLKLPQLHLENQETKDQLSQWLRVVSFYSLRLLLAPSIESAILLDRMMFLHENGNACLMDSQIIYKKNILLNPVCS